MNKGLVKGIAKISLIIFALALVGFFVLNFVLPSFASEARIWTDKEDYIADETVLISGEGFTAASESNPVQIKITRPDGNVIECPDDYWCTDALPTTSSFSNYPYKLNGILGTYIVEASDGVNIATTSFTDWSNVKNVTVNGQSSVTVGPGETIVVTDYGGECQSNCTCLYSQTSCDDGIECTIDSCDAQQGCIHTPNNSLCVDEDPCTEDVCDIEKGCLHIFSDEEGPITSDVVANPYKNNGRFNATATITDECSPIKTAKYYIGHVSSECPGSCSPICAEKNGTIYPLDDGSFDLDKLTEYVGGTFNYPRDGLNYICIEGQDTQNNWGNCVCDYFEVDAIGPNCAYDIYLDDKLYPEEYLICGNNVWLNATVCDEESKIQGGEYFIDIQIPPIPTPWSGIWMNTLYNFTRYDGWKCSIIGALVDTSGLSEGTHYIRLRGKDAVENWGKIEDCLGVSFVKDTLAPQTTKTLIPVGGVSHECTQEEINEANLPEGISLTEGCQFVKSGTQIVLHAEDPDPQQTGEHAGNTKIHYVVWYKVNPEDEWTRDQEGMGEPNQNVTITLNKDSYHLVEYWAVDACGWEENHHYELGIVDDKPPVTTKIVGEPKILCEETQDCDYWITQQTKITLSCMDQEPHPSNHVKVYWRYKIDNGQFTEWFVDEDGYLEFTFQEDSLHTLEYYCVDVLGNEEQIHREIDKVDTVPPTTTKTYGQPLVEGQGGYPKWINSSTLITLTAVDGGTVCAVGVDKIYWRNTIVPNEACENPNICAQQQGTSTFQEYTGPIYKAEESCHLIEYYAVDKLGNAESVKKQCVFVENTPPISQKNLGTPKHECTEEEKLQYGINDCWFVTDETPIELSCSDQQPHPVNDVKIHYKIEWKMNWEDDWQTVEEETVGNYIKFYYEDLPNYESFHKLTWYCVDALGNKEQEYVELDIVDTKPSVSQKTLGDPKHACTPDEQALYYQQMPNPTDGCFFINKSTPITITCSDQAPHPVNHVKIYYKDWVVGSDEPEWTIVNDDHVTITKTQDSAHILKWYCVDELGNKEDIHTEYDIVDTVPPTIDVTIIGPYFYNATEVKVYIDGATVIQVDAVDPEPHPVNHVTCDWDYTVTDGTKIGSGQTNVIPPFNITFPEESTHELTIICKDVLGNERVEIRTFIVDKTPPTTTKTYGQPLIESNGGYPKWITSQTPITLTVEDTGQHKSGIKATYYRVTLVSDDFCASQAACEEADGSGDWLTYTQPFTIKDESCRLIEYYSVDNVDKNEPVKKQCVYVDNTPPVSSKTISEPKHACLQNETLEGISDCWYITQNTEINITCSDQQPHPVDQVKIYYKIDWKNESDDNWQEGQWQEDSNFVSIKYSQDSYHKLTWYCVDALGNKEQEYVELDIVDTKPPVSTKSFIGTAIPCSQLPCAVSGDCDYYINQSTKIELTCIDQEPHPVNHVKIYYRYKVDEGSWTEWTEYTEPIQYGEDSKHTLEWYCVDELNNTEETHVEDDRVDTTPPETIKNVGQPNWNDGYWVTSQTPITLTSVDKEVACAAGPWELYYRVSWDKNCDGDFKDSGEQGLWKSIVVNNTTCKLEKTLYLEGECLHQIEWYAKDILNNTEQIHVQQHMVDNTPPHVLILKPVDGWYSSGEDIPIVAEAKDLNNANGPCEKGCNNCGGLGASCAVGIENGAQCYAYLLDMQFLNSNPDKMFNMSKWNKYDLITEGTLLYNAAAKECQGYATIPNTEMPDGIYILVVGVEDSLHNKANSFDEIKLAIKQRCGQDPYDLCEPECVDDVLQDIILSWNLPKIGIDNHAPIVTIISPQAESLFGGEQVYVEANVIDSQHGQITSTITSGTPCYITLGGVSLGTVPYNNELRKCYGTIMIPQDKDFPQGEQELIVRIADNAGNIGEGTVIVKVDTVKPTLQIITPANNQFVKEIQQINFTAIDENLNTSAIKISTDNGQTWKDVTGGPTLFTYEWDTSKETDGMAYGIIAKATDLAGNTGYSEIVIVIVDNGAPEGVYIIDPIKNEIVSGNITLKALATDYVSGVQSVKIYVNPNSWNCDATLVSGTWQCDFDSALLPDGQHNVYAVATDNLGHQTTSVSVPFIIDNNPPTTPSPFDHIPSEGNYEYDRDGIVTWYWGPSYDAGAGVDHYILELNEEYIIVYGTPNPEGWITYTISDLFDAMYKARVKAIDKAGHESDWTNYDDVIVDKIKPSPVSISTSGNENSPYDINGNYNVNWLGGADSNFDKYELFENDVIIYSGSNNSMLFANKSDGSYEYYVVAYDKAGWSTSSNKIKVIVDTQVPHIQITGIVPGIGFFIATYSVSDPEPSSGIDRIVPTSDGYALCSGTVPTGFCTVFLGSELNLTVYDKAGNSNTASTTGEEKDITKPTIIYSSPSGVIEYNEITLEVRTNEPTICYYGLEDNISTMVEMTSDEGKTIHTAYLGTLKDGLKVYHVICVDLSGNWMDSSKTIVFYIDTTGNYELVIPDYGHYWSVGWNTFWLPQLILDDICNESGPYPVEKVLSSLYEGENANFDIIWYFNGTDWLAFIPQYPQYSDLQYFNDQSSLPYYIHMLVEDRLEIDLRVCGYDLGPEQPPE